MADSTLYDSDIRAWSEQQAEALRRLAGRADLPNELDLEHLAEEIEDIGHSELRDVRVLLRRVMTALLLKWAAPAGSAPDLQWAAPIVSWLGEAELRCTPSMHEALDVEALWAGALRHAGQCFAIDGDDAAKIRLDTLAGSACPFPAADLVGGDFSLARALERIEALGSAKARA